jgi:hypothetical protein
MPIGNSLIIEANSLFSIQEISRKNLRILSFSPEIRGECLASESPSSVYTSLDQLANRAPRGRNYPPLLLQQSLG